MIFVVPSDAAAANCSAGVCVGLAGGAAFARQAITATATMSNNVKSAFTSFDNLFPTPHYGRAVNGKPAPKTFRVNLIKTVYELQQRILSLIQCGVDSPCPDAEFNAIALAVFAFQYENNRTYRAYCDQQKRTPRIIANWKDIPAVPTSAFKDFP